MVAASTVAKEIARDLRIAKREFEWLTSFAQEDWDGFGDAHRDGQRIEWSVAVKAIDRLERCYQADQMSAEQAARYGEMRKALTDAEGMLVARDCVLPRFLAQKAA